MNATAPVLDAILASWPPESDDSLPGWFVERQRRALDRTHAADWPARGDEAWKYTSLQALGQAGPTLPTAGQARGPDPTTGISGLAFVDGRAVVSGPPDLPEGVVLKPLSRALREDPQTLRFAIGRESDDGDVFDHLNAAFAADGAWLRIADGVDAGEWLSLRSQAGTSPHWHLAHRIEVGENACLRLCVDLARTADAATLMTLATRIRVQRGGRLELAWMADAGSTAAIARTRIDLEPDADLQMHVFDAGAAPSRHDLRIFLRGEGAHARVGGVQLIDGAAHADTQLDLRHEAPRTASRAIWRAVAAGRGRAVLNGHIAVQPGADGTDAQLACKSLLLSGQAEIDVKPVLEIHADDVKCAHGATVGQLDEQALFYLRSRGLSAAAARALLLRAFCSEPFAEAADSPASARLSSWLEERAP